MPGLLLLGALPPLALTGVTLDTLEGAALIATFIGVLIIFAMWVTL